MSEEIKKVVNEEQTTEKVVSRNSDFEKETYSERKRKEYQKQDTPQVPVKETRMGSVETNKEESVTKTNIKRTSPRVRIIER